MGSYIKLPRSYGAPKPIHPLTVVTGILVLIICVESAFLMNMWVDWYVPTRPAEIVYEEDFQQQVVTQITSGCTSGDGTGCNTTGTNNVAIGNGALQSVTVGEDNVYFGCDANDVNCTSAGERTLGMR